jgi:hypothetical protein
MLRETIIVSRKVRLTLNDESMAEENEVSGQSTIRKENG